MDYFRNLDAETERLFALFKREDRWLITINADPDAMASAMALRRIMARRVAAVEIAKVNAITRPDNLAMVHYLRIHMHTLTPGLLKKFDCFAIVDSQPGHHPDFSVINYSIIMDHHRVDPKNLPDAPFLEIHPEYGANATLLTEYLYSLRIRPGKLLATALLFGIKADTMNFERSFQDVDARAYQYLGRLIDHSLLLRIVRSEYHLQWLPYLTLALGRLHQVKSGLYACIGELETTDPLVFIADFLMRVHEVRWTAVCGVSEGKIVIIFRGDGITRNLGVFASQHFGDVGSAGGHKAMARAEIPLEAAEGRNVEFFVYKRLNSRCKQ